MQQSMPRSMMTRRQTFGLAGLLYPLLSVQAFGQRNRDRDLITIALDEVSLVEKRAIDAAMTYRTTIFLRISRPISMHAAKLWRLRAVRRFSLRLSDLSHL